LATVERPIISLTTFGFTRAYTNQELTLPSIPITIGVEQTFQQRERKISMQAAWVEIPVHDLETAATFDQTVLVFLPAR
jgi:hypothetical protein